jgi:hypothetical protein
MMILPAKENNQGRDNIDTSQSLNIDVSNLGPVAGYMFNQTELANMPGIGPALSGALQSSLSGANPEQVGMSMFNAGLGSSVATAINSISPGIPGLPSIGASLATESLKEDPNYSASALRSGINAAAGFLGNLALPGIGGVAASSLADYVSSKSFKDGFLGDITDSRRNEKERDAIERDFGVGTETTKSMADFQDMLDQFGIEDKSFGLKSAYDTTPTGQLEKTTKETGVFSPPKTLSEYLDRLSNDLAGMGIEDDKKDLSSQLSTVSGALEYGQKHGLNLDDMDMAMSEARGHAGLDRIGSFEEEQTEEDKRDFGEFEESDDTESETNDPGGWGGEFDVL